MVEAVMLYRTPSMSNPSDIPPFSGKPGAANPGPGGNRPGVPARTIPQQSTGVSSAQVLAELLQSQRQVSQLTHELHGLKAQLNRRAHQMGVLQQVAEILAATPKAENAASVLNDVLVQEFGCRRSMVWIMEDGGARYRPRAAHGLPRAQWDDMSLPAPNPFPENPMVLFQAQWLDYHHMDGALAPFGVGNRDPLYYIPFEHQLLLLGFAIIQIPQDRRLEPEEVDSLNILQRQAAVTIYNAWLFRDLYEQRETLQKQALALEDANAALKRADQMKSEFLALTSHELRTPLTGILGFTKLVMDGLYNDEAEMIQMLSDSYSSGKHLLSLLNDILDLAKIESGRLEMNVHPISLHIVVEEVKAIAEAYPRKPGVALTWPEDLQSLPEVNVDPHRLKQVLLNILSNALKFTREGSVRLEAERGPGIISVRVVDTGIGVEHEAQKRLFNKFAQADGGHAREFGGTGLGLVICKHLMEMMGGTIGLFSEGQGKGSTMTITLPIA